MNHNLEVGKIIEVSYGPSVGTIGIIIDIVDEKRCLIDGPCGRQIINLKRIGLTTIKEKFMLNTRYGTKINKLSSKNIYYLWIKNKILKKWYDSYKGKRFLKNHTRKNFTDFENFKFMVGKKHLSRFVYLNKNARE